MPDILPVCNYTSRDSSVNAPKSAVLLQSLVHLCKRAQKVSATAKPPAATASPPKSSGWSLFGWGK